VANRLSARADKRVMLIAAGGGDRPLRNPHRDWGAHPTRFELVTSGCGGRLPFLIFTCPYLLFPWA